MKTPARWCLPALLSLAWSAHALAAASHDAKPPADRAVQPGEGVLLVSVTANIPVVQQFDRLTIQRLPDPVAAGQAAGKPEDWVLRQVSRGMARDTALFAGVVPAGHYRIQGIADDETTKFLAFGAPQQQLLGGFTVAEGATADLGRLVVTPVNERVLVGRSALLPDNAALVASMSPDDAAALPQARAGGWEAARSADDHAEEIAFAEPTGARAPVALDNGLLAVPARFGSLLLRNGEGRWRSLRTGGLDSLLCAVRGDSAAVELYAGGEANTLLAIDAAAKVQRLDAGDLPMGSILFLGNGGEHGWWLLHERGAALTLYHSGRLAGGHWEPVRTLETGTSFWSGQIRIWVLPTRAGLLLARSDEPLHFLDFATGAWTDRPLPGGGRIVELLAGVPGAIGLLTGTKSGFAGAFSSSYLTRDDGQTWSTFTPPKKIRMLPPLVLGEGTLVQQSVSIGFAAQGQVYQVSHDDGKTWKTLETKLPANAALHVLGGGALLGVASWPQWNIEQLWAAPSAEGPWQLEHSNYFDPPAKPAK